MASIDFDPRFRRWTPETVASFNRIYTCLGSIQKARLLPAAEDELRSSAIVGTVHYSNLIEGNELPMIEAERAARGELEPDTKAKIELVNYVDALDLVDQRLSDGLVVDGDFLQKLHGAVTKGLGRDEDPHFKPHHEGKWRDGIARVVDRLTGTVMHEGPPAAEVEGRMEGLCSWLDRKAEKDPPFVLAVVAHYAITDIHPFADGNGRVARLLQAAMLMRADVLPGRMFSFERYYAEDRPAYYGALRSVRENTFNMEQWLHYALAGLAEEYERVAAKVIELSDLAFGDATTLQLSSSQQRGLTRLRSEGRREFARADYETAAGVGRTTAADDLQRLRRHGVVRVLGRGPATRYAFPVAPGVSTKRQGAGRPRAWTDERIERELRAFLAHSSVGWPSHEDFRAAGQGGLYAAASRNGGIRRWRHALGR